MGSSGFSHGGSSSSYTPQPSWDELTPEEKQARIEQRQRAEVLEAERRSNRRKAKAKKIGLGILITVLVIGAIVGLIFLLVHSCAS